MNLSGGTGDGDGGPLSVLSRWHYAAGQRYQYLLDKSTPHVLWRWIAFAGILLSYALRVYLAQGYFIITYALGIYILQLFLAFLSPQVDPESAADGPSLPTRGSDEFRPFVRRLPEFKLCITKAFCIAFVLSFFSWFDVPVFWPILLFYWLVLFVSTMKRQIMHMVKYKYVPFSFGKQELPADV
ncbi:hypothetical protein RJ640_006945 [Escallonia rubra]|uniref:Protein RER1 n=1 Tax=Escallonia rubra TaxID=112253 RepID=A0AA88QNQ6_9ASTE|nr:hypothetical protein RJ640_006945 [Escallonia rubra]